MSDADIMQRENIIALVDAPSQFIIIIIQYIGTKSSPLQSDIPEYMLILSCRDCSALIHNFLFRSAESSGMVHILHSQRRGYGIRCNGIRGG